MPVKFIVTTSIYPPTEATRKYAAMEDWSLVVVADKKTPVDLYRDINCCLLDCNLQSARWPHLSDLIGWDAPERKSLGVLFAYEQGADIIATDLEPTEKNHWCSEGKFYMDVEKIAADDAIKKYPGRNVFMAWPPYDNPMAYEVVKNMGVGRKLVFVGEGYGGCTGDDNFFQYLETNFEEIDIDFTIPRWSGIYDGVRHYIKTK